MTKLGLSFSGIAGFALLTLGGCTHPAHQSSRTLIHSDEPVSLGLTALDEFTEEFRFFLSTDRWGIMDPGADNSYFSDDDAWFNREYTIRPPEGFQIGSLQWSKFSSRNDYECDVTHDSDQIHVRVAVRSRALFGRKSTIGTAVKVTFSRIDGN